MGVRGPRKRGSTEPLPWLSDLTGGERFRAWCAEHLQIPKGHGAGSPLTIHDYQLRMLSGVLGDERKRHNLVIAPRGMAKSTTIAALTLYLAFDQAVPGGYMPLLGATEPGSTRLLGTVKRLVELSPALSERSTSYRDRIVVPASGSEIVALPPTVTAVEGSDVAPIAVIDEIGFVHREVYESAVLSCGKRPGSGVLAIGTPPQPKWSEASPLLSLRDAALADDRDVHLVEFSATHCDDPFCMVCLREAYGGALGTVIELDDLLASRPPKTSVAEWTRTRLARYVQNTDESFIPADLWAAIEDPHPVPDGADVILGLDGSLSGDATALVAATVSETPHLSTVALWERPSGASEWRVPMLEVEQAVRDAAKRYRVREIAADPAYYERSLQVLHSEGLPVTRFPWSGNRAKAASHDYRAAVIAGLISHDGGDDLRRHHVNAIHTDAGLPAKASKHSTRHIDLLAASIMAVSRATWLARKPRKRAISIRRRR